MTVCRRAEWTGNAIWKSSLDLQVSTKFADKTFAATQVEQDTFVYEHRRVRSQCNNYRGDSYTEWGRFQPLFLPKHMVVLILSVGHYSYHFSPLLSWSGFTEAEHVTTHRYLSPHPWLGVFCKSITGMHNKNSICGQSIHLPIWCLPLCSFLLRKVTSMKT